MKHQFPLRRSVVATALLGASAPFYLLDSNVTAFVNIPSVARRAVVSVQHNEHLQLGKDLYRLKKDNILVSKLGSLQSPSTSQQQHQIGFLEKIAITISQRYNSKLASPTEIRTEQDRRRVSVLTLLRVGIPSIIAAFGAALIFPALAITLATALIEPGVFSVLSQDSSQFVQNFLTVAGLLFSILVGQTYYFLYQQQESVYYALFQEVTEAKSLLEQVALVCQGRSMYQRCLESIAKYVENDLKQIQKDPAILLSARPVDDPLESIMYMTSVGVPSTVYETIKSLREARAARLGSLQRKLPSIHMILLWVLAAIELVSFPLLGAGTQTLGGYNILTVEGVLFGVMTGGIVMTLRVVGELWRPAGGAYNVDSVLSVMVSGLEEELTARMTGRKVDKKFAPSGARDTVSSGMLLRMEPMQADDLNVHPTTLTIQQQGANPALATSLIYRWIRRRLK